MGRNRKRVTLTINPELWERCQALQEKVDISWSRVVEQILSGMLDMIEPSAAGEEVTPAGVEQSLIAMQTVYAKAVMDTNKIYNEVKAQKSKN